MACRQGHMQDPRHLLHEAEPANEIELSDDPESRSHAQVQLVIAVEHPVGEYRLKEMAAEYPGGRVVRFAETPEASLRVVEEEIRSPEVVGWRWL